MWNKIIGWFEAAGRARAAAEFARMGRHDIAQKIIMNDRIV